MLQAYFTFAKQIFHNEAISLVPKERISLKKHLLTASAFSGTPGETRTHYLALRRRTLYPGELRRHIAFRF